MVNMPEYHLPKTPMGRMGGTNEDLYTGAHNFVSILPH
jgi:hypothetical protein